MSEVFNMVGGGGGGCPRADLETILDIVSMIPDELNWESSAVIDE